MGQDLTQLAEGIYHQKTKDYFQEVLSSYKNENYRSAVVMLYTVVICDLIFKLNDLRDIHNDEKARKILEDLETDKEENPVSPVWENNLIEKAFKEAKLLENDVYTHITTLKKYRNLSGHPVLNSLEILFRPNKEMVESLMINILEGLLNKHPLFTKNVFIPFLVEIERIKNDFSTESRLEIYLESKFFVHFNKELVEYIFKHLWKCVFKSNGKKEAENRNINYKVLLIIYKRYKEILFEYVKKEQSHFSDFLDEDSSILDKFVDFLSKYPNVYFLLKEHSKQLLNNRIQSKTSLKIKSYFLSDSLESHLTKLSNEFHTTAGNYYNQPYALNYILNNTDIDFLFKVCKEYSMLPKFYDLMIKHYYHSHSYDVADILFSCCIRPYYTEFSREQMELLLTEANHNPQCYNGRDAKDTHSILFHSAKEFFGEDVRKKYSYLFYSI
ncbi:hypothetical protein MMB68_10455 [Priestia sp. Y58]|uniref:hypothetical protein n=1 Tax=Priestia sp. Y58 TaxID=2922804 RepID=UPI0024061075|nr:hypothetical protein [Priestia sp. Y58]MDG0029977.1 hypothetical protein [Priestia sp. Y58]